MKSYPYRFRSVEDWKSSLMVLPDSSFFELVRSIFGNIKTPFNKQRLMDDLFVLLSREDIRKTIAAYIDQEDHKIIAATALLEDPAPEELEKFFQGDYNPASLRSLLVNLEERLILFRFRDDAYGAKRRLALNPVLEAVLSPLAADKKILFPFSDSITSNSPESEEYEKISITDNRILAALISFISGEEDFYKAEGIRKRVLDQGKKLFPGLDLVVAAGVLQQLGLFNTQDEKFIPDLRRIQEFGALSPLNRREYWAAGLYLYLNQIDTSNEFGFPRGWLKNLAFLIHRFCNFLDPQKQYPDITFRRWVNLLEREDFQNPWNKKIHFETFIKTLEMAGIINPKSEIFLLHKIIPVPVLENAEPLIAMDSAFSFIMYPGISFDHAFKLASFSSLREDTPFGLELSRSSVVRGFDRGIKAENILSLLKELSGNRIDDSLEWNILDWEKRYTAVSLFEGLILSLSEDRRYLIETGPVSSLVINTLAPGLYLLSGDSQDAVEILQRAGVDIIAQPRHELKESPGMTKLFTSFKVTYNTESSDSESNPFSFESSPETVKEQFKHHLKGLKFSKAEKDELLSRIERRLVFNKTQLEKAAIKYEKLEARLLDYPGKTAIAKQAIADGSLVELSWPGLNGKINNNFGLLQALEKKEGEYILVLKPLSETEDSDTANAKDIPPDIIRVPLGKISLLRRIKQSIFEI